MGDSGKYALAARTTWKVVLVVGYLPITYLQLESSYRTVMLWIIAKKSYPKSYTLPMKGLWLQRLYLVWCLEPESLNGSTWTLWAAGCTNTSLS